MPALYLACPGLTPQAVEETAGASESAVAGWNHMCEIL